MSVVESPSENASVCGSCGSPLVADQRYCLACGQPASPVRLAFLDVLQSEQLPSERGVYTTAAGYVPPEQGRATGWLRRYSGLLSLLTVLLIAILIGLLIGHWLTQKDAPTNQVITVKGLSAPAAAAPTSTAATPPSSTSSSSSSGAGKSSSPSSTTKEAESASSEEAQEVKEAKESETKTALPPPVKADSNTLQKLKSKTGKNYQQEINKLVNGDQPIEG